MTLLDDIKLMDLLGSISPLSTATDSLRNYLKEELTVADLETTQELKRECVVNFLSVAFAFEKQTFLGPNINNQFVEIKDSEFKKYEK
ncbi:hypothetical protein BGZ99_002903 [Dissophora globulifera]|uniref:Uncharacterized protein n=1 Tax=Dissophora globulifera TaxID=979702 RepID=A0A9P6RRD6_9FUNG|nr:hypothetical protein BGZ99_002903 [Dissophora globulifera]